jgi:predicted ATPase with chaperone activity
LPKSGPSFDLAIAVALLIANQTLPNCEDTVFLGELSLDGKVRSVRGALPALLAAAKAGITRAVVPAANLAEAKLMVDLEIIPMQTLAEVLRWLRTGERVEADALDLQCESDEGLLDFADVSKLGKKSLRRKEKIQRLNVSLDAQQFSKSQLSIQVQFSFWAFFDEFESVVECQL